MNPMLKRFKRPKPEEPRTGIVFNKTDGKFDVLEFEPGAFKRGERPEDAIRRSDTQTAMGSPGYVPPIADDEEHAGAMFAAPGLDDDRSPLDRRYKYSPPPEAIPRGSSVRLTNPEQIGPNRLPSSVPGETLRGFADRFLGRPIQDVKETIQDLKDEPGEVPYRTRERLRAYRPR